MSVDTENLLKERGKTHGEYAEHAAATQGIMDVLMSHRNWPHLPPMIRESLHMFAHKMGRVVTGDPCHCDHYDDIAGYAKLISQRMQVVRAQYLRNVQLAVESRPETPEDGGHYERDNGPLIYKIPKSHAVVSQDAISLLDPATGLRHLWTRDNYHVVAEAGNYWEIHDPRSGSFRQLLERIVSPNRQEI